MIQTIDKPAELIEPGDKVPFGGVVAVVVNVEHANRVGFGRIVRIHFDRGYYVDWAPAQSVTVAK